MNYDISRWLKDELGLSHMSEADLNCLIFHPRSGSLCRRFVDFLAESTLCSIKYPNVYAKEEYMAAVEEIATKNRDLLASVKELKEIARVGENDMRELEFLKTRLSQMKTLQQLLRSQSETLDAIANRPNLLIEQLGRNLDNPEYLSNSSLAFMYELDEDFKPDTIITSRQMAAIDDRLRDLVKQIDSINTKATQLAQNIHSKMNNIELDLKIPRVVADDLESLKAPPIEEVVEDPHKDEKVLRDINCDLFKRLSDLNQQVSKLDTQYKSRRAEIRAAKSQELRECLALLGEPTVTSQTQNSDLNSSILSDSFISPQSSPMRSGFIMRT